MSWLREKHVDLLEYLPAFLSSDKEFKNLTDVLSQEHETIRADLHWLLNEVIITTDSSYGLSLWEAALELSPSADATEDERRRDIILHLQAKNVSTIRFMTALAKRYCTPETTVKIEEHNEEYAFDVTMEGELIDRDGLRRAIELYKPAHLDCSIKEIVALVEYLAMKEGFLGNVVADTMEYYPWIGRYYNGVYSYGGACQMFDGSWIYDGDRDYDGNVIKEEESHHPLIYDGFANYDGTYKFTPFGRASTPLIHYDSKEPDVLSVASAIPELEEHYTACYQYNGGIFYDGQTHYGYDEGPQESTDVEHVEPMLSESEKAEEQAGTDITPNIVELYPYGRTRFYNGAFTYGRMNVYDGSEWYGSEWKYDGAPMARPPEFIVTRFDGATVYDGARTYEAPRLQGVRCDSDTADELHESIESVDVENIELEEDVSAVNAFEATEMYASRVFDGNLTYDGASRYETNYLEENGTTQVGSTVKEQFKHSERFDAAHTYDGSTSYTGEADGPKDEINVLLYIGRQYNGLTNYDGGAAVHFDGASSYQGDRTYAGFREINFVYDKSATYDGTRRYARPCETYDVYKVPA